MIYSWNLCLIQDCENEWIGDGNCDDGNNNQQCNFDGGDCCGPDVKTDYCTECICREEEVAISLAKLANVECSSHFFKENMEIYCVIPLIDLGAITHTTALDACRSLGAHLPILTTEDDQKNIFRKRKMVS